MPSSHLILCHPLLLLPSIFPSIRVFSNESALYIRWPKYWNFSFNISPFNEHPGLISFRMDWLDLLAVQGTLTCCLSEMGFPGDSAGKESAYNVGNLGSIPELGRSSGEGNGYPLQYSGLENSMDYSRGSLRVGHSWVTFTFTILMWNSNWTGCPAFYLPTPVSFHLYLEPPVILLSQSASLFSFGEDSVKKKSPFSWSFSWHTLSHQPSYNHPLIKWRMGGNLDVLKYFPKCYLILPSNPERYVCVLVAQSCSTLSDSMDYSPPGSSVHEILLSRILEWVAISSSRGYSQPRDWTHVCCVSHLSHQGSLRDLL